MTVELETALVVERRSSRGEVLSQLTLDPEIFAVPVNVPLLHQVITAQLANRRAGTQSTKTRAEVAGGSSKPFRQKGTGNARQGSIRAPHYAGGGVALGPKPRSYAQRTPKKMVQAALRCALSDRASESAIRLVDHLSFPLPKTKDALATLAALSCEGKVLVVLGREDEVAARSFSNLPHVVTVPGDQLSAYDVLCADVVLFTDETLPGAEGYRPPVETEHEAHARAEATAVARAEAEAEAEERAEARAEARAEVSGEAEGRSRGAARRRARDRRGCRDRPPTSRPPRSDRPRTARRRGRRHSCRGRRSSES